MWYFPLLFFGTKSLKFGVCITPTVHLILDKPCFNCSTATWDSSYCTAQPETFIWTMTLSALSSQWVSALWWARPSCPLPLSQRLAIPQSCLNSSGKISHSKLPFFLQVKTEAAQQPETPQMGIKPLLGTKSKRKKVCIEH